MGTTHFCDRCGDRGVQLVPVLGVELCNACVSDFPAWVAKGRTGKVVRVIQRGQWAARLLELARTRGVITPDDVAAAFGVPRKQAHWQCNYHAREGVLRAVGQARFAAAPVSAEAAE